MRITLDTYLYLEHQNGIWYLSSNEPGQVAWKAEIPQLIAAWRHNGQCAIRAGLKEAQYKNAELEAKIAKYEEFFYINKNGVYVKRDHGGMRAKDFIEEHDRFEKELRDTRARLEELQAERDEATHHIQTGRERLEKIATQAAELSDYRKTIQELEAKVAEVETLKRELALARPTWEEWVERIKKAPGFKIAIAEGPDTAVWACLGACNYFPSSKARELLDIPDIHNIDNNWEKWTCDQHATQAIRATKQWAEKAKRQKLQE